MNWDKPQCLYCGSENLERRAISMSYECMDCHKLISDLARHWSFIEKGKIKNDLTGEIGTLNKDGDSFTIGTRTVP